MTARLDIPAGPKHAGEGPWAAEARRLLMLGAPMALTQLVQFSVHTIDVVMIGRLGPEPLAASSLGLVMFYAGWMLLMGPAVAVSPLVSQALGAKADDYDDVRRSVRMCLWASALATPVLTVIYLYAGDLARLLGQPASVARLAGPYVLALVPGLFFSLGIMTLRNFLAALNLTRAPLLIVVFTTVLNAFLNWLLIFGALGAPRLELVGAGIASSIAHATGFFLLVIYCRQAKAARAFHLWRDFFGFDMGRMKEVIALGLPISVTMLFEGMLFNACVLLVGRIGIAEMAAYQVALNVSAIAFMAPLGFSMAGAVRVGLHAGARNRAGVERAAVLTVGICIGAIALFAIPIMVAPGLVSALYLDRADPANRAVLDYVTVFLRIAAGFMLFDAIQVACNQALRGLKDVRMPMVITGIAYWLIGFPLAAYLGLASPMGAAGVWWGLLASLAAAAAMLGTRLYRLVRHAPMSQLTETG